MRSHGGAVLLPRRCASMRNGALFNQSEGVLAIAAFPGMYCVELRSSFSRSESDCRWMKYEKNLRSFQMTEYLRAGIGQNFPENGCNESMTESLRCCACVMD